MKYHTFLGVALFSLGVALAASPFPVVQLPPEALTLVPEPPASGDRRTLLEELAQRVADGPAWREWAVQHGLLVEGEAVLLELRFAAPPPGALLVGLEKLGVRIHGQAVPTLMEAWVPAATVTGSGAPGPAGPAPRAHSAPGGAGVAFGRQRAIGRGDPVGA